MSLRVSKINIPERFRFLLEGSEYEAPVLAVAESVGTILYDNDLTFFPYYTDHGTNHVSEVLKSEVELIPDGVWERSAANVRPRLLCDADASVIVVATLLHDIAMHLRPTGFLEVIGKGSRFRPLPWFQTDRTDHNADLPWDELWEAYEGEAKQFSARQLTNIVGESAARHWKFAGLPAQPGERSLNERLIIGEFLRRHHAELAHEIAIYGFPGLPLGSGEGQFPAMGANRQHPFNRLADLAGLAARSHGMSLRVCKSYLDANAYTSGTPRPMGCAVLYSMALLRVADYLQLDFRRAPAVLLQLRDPQSPKSLDEWNKHRAVANIGPSNDPRARMITVSNDLPLSLFLQLKELFLCLQSELDRSTAVLDEVYGNIANIGLDKLKLAISRIHSNLTTRAFQDGLPYVPEKAGFSADPRIITLLVEPLYGNYPGVGIRELIQNSTDAVRERRYWCQRHRVNEEDIELRKQESDVSIHYVKSEFGKSKIIVSDRGIGMKWETIANYFLRAGASFRNSVEWSKEFLRLK